VTDMEYDVVYVARSPASMKQDEFAAIVDETCNGRAAGGWRLVSAVGDYGAVVTLGVWLFFAREAASERDQPLAETDAGRDVRGDGGLDEGGSAMSEPILTLPPAAAGLLALLLAPTLDRQVQQQGVE